MRFHYAGKFSGDPEDLPKRDPMPAGAVKFEEAEDPKTLVAQASAISLAVLAAMLAVFWLVRRPSLDELFGGWLGQGPLLAIALSLVAAVPHEFIHAACFKEDVYMYTNISQGMLFVVGPEDMTKARFVTMSAMPAIVLGLVPFAVGLLPGTPYGLAIFGAFSASYAAGDFINIYHALTQVPKGALTYLSGFNSWWYVPEER